MLALLKTANPGLGPIVGFGLVLLAVLVAGCAQGAMGQAVEPAKREGTERQPAIPPLDAAAPERTETATFALG